MTQTTNFTEELRYKYEGITAGDYVVDLGGYHGAFARAFNLRYGCHVYCFEPIRAFYTKIVSQPAVDRVHVFNCGVGDLTHFETFRVKGDMTGRFADGPPEHVIIVSYRALRETLHDMHPGQRGALIKINIEGGEFELLECMIRNSWQYDWVNIQVQFHPVFAGAEARWQQIRNELLKSHELTYDFPWCWENYRIKND